LIDMLKNGGGSSRR
jgi:hypothetical protein